ncbi:uncharacterized protein N7518_006138 [Penicillium psychrosexuale]|uniref:uncharacterized protein n=1 Tax=Penicillium psychrosexuale TaxID=1002107 RepID=UPI00254558AC|nr:uncharacterized protein N7518_006138 [Penicillium psychrosexuale]KAJ5789127.1 hypothetical protein N7518_006138 [Penicillium psychrosexuale]
MADQIENLEDRTLEAVHAYHKAEKPNIAQLAREFEVPYQRLRARIHRRGTKTTAASLKKTLSPIQEKRLQIQFYAALEAIR